MEKMNTTEYQVLWLAILALDPRATRLQDIDHGVWTAHSYTGELLATITCD